MKRTEQGRLLRGHEPLQLLIKELDDDELRRRRIRLACRLQHQKPLPVWRDIVVPCSVGSRCRVGRSVDVRYTRREGWRVAGRRVSVIEGLNGPRGLAVGPAGGLIYAEGDGSFSEVVGRGRNGGSAVPLGAVPPTFIAPALATLGGQVFVLTAGGPPGSGAANDLLRVLPNGRIVTVARLKPRVVAVPDELPDQTPEGDPLPPAGTMLPSEAVATSVTVGADGPLLRG
jgi:hypothetical protein